MGEYSEWEEWWGHVGHVPWEGVEGIQEFCSGEHGGGKVRDLAEKTGRITLAYAEQAWTQRVKATLEWEATVGISERKAAMGLKGWRCQGGRGAGGRKGRRKPVQQG